MQRIRIILPLTSISIWTLTDGKIGMVNQCLGLAEALLELVGTGIIIEKTVKPVVPWKWLPPKLWPSFIDGAEAGNNLFEEPWPDVLIGCGRHAVGPALS